MLGLALFNMFYPELFDRQGLFQFKMLTFCTSALFCVCQHKIYG